MLKVLGVFTIGSFVGLVTFSHLLNYILKHYKNITLATIIGFIIGSLGVVWPWKKTIYQIGKDGAFKLDSTGERIVENYQRYIPELNENTFLAIGYIAIGVLIVLGLEWYGKRTRRI
jgi:putative membrane protein